MVVRDPEHYWWFLMVTESLHGPSPILIFLRLKQSQKKITTWKKHLKTRHKQTSQIFFVSQANDRDQATHFGFLIIFFSSVLEKIYKKSQEEPTWKCEVNIPVKVQTEAPFFKETHSSYHHARRMRCRKILETVKSHVMKPLPWF